MTTFVHDQEFIQPAGDPASLTAPFSSPNYVFLSNTGVEGFAGQNGTTDYIVLGNANVYGSNPGGGIAWQPGDEIQITFKIFDPAASFTVASDPAIRWTQGPPPWTGSGAQTWTATITMGTTNEWFSFTGQGISGRNSNINFSIDFEYLGNDSNPADEDTGSDDFQPKKPIIPPTPPTPPTPPAPTEVSFLGPNGGDFGNPAYWTGGVLPGATVGVDINGVAVFSSGNYDVNSVTTNPSGTLVINGGTFEAGSYVLNYGTIIITVPFAALMSPSATNYGTMRAIGGLIDFDPLQNLGTMSADSGGEIGVTEDTMNEGAIYANSGGTVYLGGQVYSPGPAFPGGGILYINGGVLVLGSSDSEQVQFQGSGQLTLNQPTALTAAINFNGNPVKDVIDLPNIVATSVRNTGAALLLTESNGQQLGLSVLNLGYNFAHAVPDGNGGTLLVFTPGVPTDMVMRNGGTGALEIYDVGNNALLGAAGMGKVGLDWKVSGFGGFSGSAGEGDMLMRNTKTGALYVYDIANNALTAAYAMGAVGLDWAVGGFGDFSGRPNETDMIMRNTKTGALEVYDIAHNALTSAFSMGAVGLDWQFAGFGNFSGRPNETDMIMRNSKTGALYVYDIVNNALTSAYSMGAVGLDWQVAGFGNFSGRPNETDMLMRNTKTGALEVYDIAHNALTAAYSMGTVGLNWTVVGFGAFGANPDESDMLMRNSSTGALELYDIYGNTIISSAALGTVGLDWQVGGIAAASPVGSTAAANGQAGATAQLVQAIAGFGGSGGAADALTTSPLGEETSQQPLFSASQHA
jgi:hypothetical protein